MRAIWNRLLHLWLYVSTGVWLLLSVASADAQLVRGTITDGLSGQPVSGATIQVLNPDSSLRAAAATRAGGAFSIKSEPGTFLLRVDHRGFLTVWSWLLPLTTHDTLNFEIRLPRSAVALGSLDVFADPSGKLDPSGFYRRKRNAMGKFLGPEVVAKMHPTQVADVVGSSLGFYSYPDWGGPITRMENRGRYCSPTVYLDNVLVAKGTSTPNGFMYTRSPKAGVQLDLLVSAAMVRAVEIYSDPGEAPAEYHAVGAGGGTDCGVIVLWTYVGFGS
jgi:hypothetical protein